MMMQRGKNFGPNYVIHCLLFFFSFFFFPFLCLFVGGGEAFVFLAFLSRGTPC